jgi:hypothetical protein
MSFTRESTAKNILDGDHAALRRRPSKADEPNIPKRPSDGSDPYGHVDSGKGSAPRVARDYGADPNTAAVEDPTDLISPRATATVRKGDPLAEAYAMLRTHGGVIFGAEREDGSWELSPGKPRETLFDPVPEEKKSSWQEMLSPETQSQLAAALEKFSSKS